MIAILLLTHLGAMAVITLVPLTWPLQLGMAVLLGWSFFRTVNLHGLRLGPQSVIEVELDKDRDISVRFAGGMTWQGGRLHASFVHPWITLLVLRFDDQQRSVTVVAAADAVEPEPFRRWRVALKFQAVTG